MLRVERLKTMDGRTMAGFFVRNQAGRALAIGAFSSDPFVMPTAKRYAKDLPLCEAIARITGLPLKWNLAMYGPHVTSGTRQQLTQIVRKCRTPQHNHRMRH